MTDPAPSPGPRRDPRSRGMRHEQGVLVCPRCQVPLRGSDHELGIAWRCASCGGQSLNFSQFRRLVPEEGANDIWLQAVSRPHSPRRSTDCPECQAAMGAVLIPFRGRQVELDICRSCQRLWLDPQEESSVVTSALVSVSAAVPAVRRRGWFGALAPATPAGKRQQSDALLDLLEHNAERLRRKEGSRWLRPSLALGLAAAGMVYILLGWLGIYGRWRFYICGAIILATMRTLRK